MKKLKNLQVCEPDQRTHGAGIYDLLCKTFSGEDEFYGALDWCENTLADPVNHLDWHTSRIALNGDMVVGNFAVWDYRTRVGRARLRTGGIGCVAAHGRYRKQGIISRVVESSLEAMRGDGYDISILFGIPDFYHRFGYVRAWSETTLKVDLDEIDRQKAPPNLRRFQVAGDMEAARLYNRTHAALVGTAVRPTYRTSWKKSPIRAFGWRDDAGKLLGYVRFSHNKKKNALVCLEAVGPNASALGVLAKMARKYLCTRILFKTFPERHPLLVELRRGNCRGETDYYRRAEAMIRIIDLTRCLTSLCSEFTARLQASELASWRGELLIADGREKARLVIKKSGVTVLAGGTAPNAIRGGDRVAQLLLGSDDPLEIVAHDRMRLSGDARRLLPVLFPDCAPCLSGADRY
ncbi:MAG: GNAT family N-acetyltransferase [bacterium]|nr:GNAT family N-acetyltransferase [bacterium]